MRDWNVIVTIHSDRFRSACELLEPLGPVKRTNYYNVIVMKVQDIHEFLETLRDWMSTYPDTAESIARVAPVSVTFEFQSPEEFETRAREALLQYCPQLAGKRFHVRMHRRGHKEHFAALNEEQFLGGILVDELERAGTPADVDFDDPDAIVDVETVDNRAGLALWTRQQLQRYPFLKLD